MKSLITGISNVLERLWPVVGRFPVPVGVGAVLRDRVGGIVVVWLWHSAESLSIASLMDKPLMDGGC
jgi:hypothetical protein